jgi:hypothetical protein
MCMLSALYKIYKLTFIRDKLSARDFCLALVL